MCTYWQTEQPESIVCCCVLVSYFTITLHLKPSIMDQQNQGQSPSSNLFDLQVDHHVNNYLSEAAKWGKFLGILGMIFCGLIVLFGLFFGSMVGAMMPMGDGMGAMGAMGAGFFTVIYLIIALVYFLPCLFLFRFGSHAQTALKNNEQAKFQSSIKNLKSCLKFMGILMIIILAIYVLAAIVGIAASAAMMS